jgi:hypothetical protein
MESSSSLSLLAATAAFSSSEKKSSSRNSSGSRNSSPPSDHSIVISSTLKNPLPPLRRRGRPARSNESAGRTRRRTEGCGEESCGYLGGKRRRERWASWDGEVEGGECRWGWALEFGRVQMMPVLAPLGL